MRPFRIQFIALTVRRTPEALRLWTELGLRKWALDWVDTEMSDGTRRIRKLAISHEAMEAPKYLTMIEGTDEDVSHIGMRATAEEAEELRAFFARRGIPVRREYTTLSHTNIPGRRFHDIFFATAPVLGVDIEVSVELPPDLRAV